jgi:hypothetical protein
MAETKHVAFCWQDKAALRRIREAFDHEHSVCTALAVYLALSEIASDAGSEEFKTTHAWIQRFSGVSVSTIKKRLSALAEIGLIEVRTPELRAASTYRLLPFGNGCPTLANGCRTIASKQGQWLANDSQQPLATSEERSEEKKTLPTAKGKGGLKAMFQEALAKELKP